MNASIRPTRPTLPTITALAAKLLLAACSVSAAASGEQGKAGIPLLENPELGRAYVDTSLPQGYSREIFLWPEDSLVLKDGIDLISNDAFANDHPELVITHPSLLLYPPKTNSTRAAIIVFPGGGYKGVAVGPESTLGFNGAEVCRWLNDNGFICAVLKYRVPNSGCSYNAKTRRHDTPEIPLALQDAQRAVSILRSSAATLGFDPDRIGALGFSAGGNLAVLVSSNFKQRAYEPIDAVDEASSRPDFVIPVYPGHLTMEHKNKRPKSVAAKELNSDIEISAEIPPTLLIHAEDDPVDPVHYSKVYERELRKAGVDVTLITYQTGGHAFGVKAQRKDSDRWMTDAMQWLHKLKFL